MNKNKNVTFDTGCVTLDETTTMTWPEQWTRAPHMLGDLPVTALEVQYGEAVPKGYTPARWEMFRAGWRAIHNDLSALSTNTQRIPVQGGHNVMAEQPELVIQVDPDGDAGAGSQPGQHLRQLSNQALIGGVGLRFLDFLLQQAQPLGV
mgnify:CR=1 FL=1